jgi:hypothetical protein
LRVVHGDQHRTFGRQHAQEREHGYRDRRALRARRIVPSPKQHHLQRVPLGLGQRGHDLFGNRSKQIEEAHERQPGLRLGGATSEHLVASRLRVADALLPYRGLADAGVAFKNQHGVALGDRIDERVDRRNLGLSPYDSPTHGCCPILARRAADPDRRPDDPSGG